MANTNEKKFNFRSKFRKYVIEENVPIITEAFEKFDTLSPDEALYFLWELTFSENSACAVITDLGLNSKIITPESLIPFRNELRYQYSKSHAKFLTMDVPDSCEAALVALTNATDIIVANIVNKHCHLKIHDTPEFMSRLLFLLDSEQENNFFGGVRSLNFSMEETHYLKFFHKEIHNLMKALYESKQGGFQNKPFANLAEKLKESGVYVPEKSENEDFSDETIEEFLKIEVSVPANNTVKQEIFEKSEFKKLSLEVILLHKDIFMSFAESDDLNLMLPIGNMGFDLNEVMDKKEKIYNFIEAAEALSE